MGWFKRFSILSSVVAGGLLLSSYTGEAQTKPKPKTSTTKKPAAKKPTVKTVNKSSGPAVMPGSLPTGQETKIDQERIPIDPDVPQSIEDPTGTALQNFFEELYLAESGYPGGRVLISQFGDSHTAADFGTSRLRRKMQSRFGDAGRGIVWAGRPVKYYGQRDVNSEQTGKWEPQNGLRRAAIEPVGIMGMRNETIDPKANFSVSNCEQCPMLNTSRFEVFYLRQENGGKMNVLLDEKPIFMLDTKLTPNEPNPTGYFLANVEDAPHKLTIQATSPDPISVFGVVLERDEPGVIVDALGVGGVEITALNRWDWSVIGEQLQRRDPSLVILHYGTNESANPTLNIARLEESFVKAIQKVKQTVPDASILVMGPVDRSIRERKDCDKKKVVKQGKKKVTVTVQPEEGSIPEGCEWKTPVVIPEIVEAQRRAAMREGVAFFDSYMAMGGSGSMHLWHKQSPSLASKDHTHLSKAGYEAVSDMLYDALLTQYDQYIFNLANDSTLNLIFSER